jgi:hypothetical protein
MRMRAYTLAALAVVALAAVLRLWNLGGLGISHWDAGTFVAGPLGVGPYGRADLAIFYAPPLLPELFHLLVRATGVVDAPAIGAVALFGVATVALLWRAGERWVGAPAALIGAAALAAMEYHLDFSRQALTDVPFTFFFAAFAWAFSAAVASGRTRNFALAGLAAGATMWTKYHGFFTLLLGAGWLAFASIAGSLRGEAAKRALRGAAITAAIAVVAGISLALVVEARVGIAALRANNVRWLAPLGLYMFPKTALFVAHCVTSWVSPCVWAPAVIGFARMAWRRTPGDLLLLAWTALFALALPFYMNYPRLCVPLLVPIALAAGVGLEGVALAVSPRFARGGGELPFAVVLVLSAAALVSGLLAARDALSIEDRGYAEAARFLRAQPASPEPDLLIAQHALLPYLAGSAQGIEVADEPGALERLREGRFRLVVADLRLAKPANAELARAIDELGLELVATIENPLPEPVLINSSGFESLDVLRSGSASREEREALTTIRIWRRAAASR